MRLRDVLVKLIASQGDRAKRGFGMGTEDMLMSCDPSSAYPIDECCGEAFGDASDTEGKPGSWSSMRRFT